VKDIVGSFAHDPRILAWDLWNEPDNEGGDPAARAAEKERLVAQLIPKIYDWAQSANPTQPLTSGVWKGEHWDRLATLNAVEKVQLTRSDVNSFHDYSWPETFAVRARQMLSFGRPVLCTEYMARGNGSTFDGDLPIAKRLNIAVINWGFVDGKTQTRLPWNSWQRPYTLEQPTIWFHDVLHADGTPYRKAEVDMIRAFAAAPKGVVPAGAQPGFAPAEAKPVPK
jgi:hypothetical protein